VVSIKTRRDTLHRSCIFASSRICGSGTAIQCIRGMNHRCAIFHGWVGPVRFHKRCIRTRYAKVVFLRSVGATGHIVYSGASGA
jgi:hypothetical protein